MYGRFQHYLHAQCSLFNIAKKNIPVIIDMSLLKYAHRMVFPLRKDSGSVSVWMQAGYGTTNPDPLWHPRNMTMFDPSQAGPQPDDDILPKAAHTLGNLLSSAAGTCRGLCQVF